VKPWFAVFAVAVFFSLTPDGRKRLKSGVIVVHGTYFALPFNHASIYRLRAWTSRLAPSARTTDVKGVIVPVLLCLENMRTAVYFYRPVAVLAFKISDKEKRKLKGIPLCFVHIASERGNFMPPQATQQPTKTDALNSTPLRETLRLECTQQKL
jgi:hypothetical protein